MTNPLCCSQCRRDHNPEPKPGPDSRLYPISTVTGYPVYIVVKTLSEMEEKE